MNGNSLNVGDIVYLAVAKDNRDWGYNPGPDGIKCEVVSYDCEVEGGGPNKYWPTVRFLEGERKDETERILTIHLSEDNPLTRAVVRDQDGNSLAQVTSENIGAFPPVIIKFHPSSSKEPGRCDIVVKQGSKVLAHHMDVITLCDHTEKVYSGEYFASDPAQWWWVCPMCGETGADEVKGGPKVVDSERFRRLLKLFGKD